jgi:predicted MFS family arabinose efflux permease
MRFEFIPSFREQFLATLAVQRRSTIPLISAAVFPLMALYLLYAIVVHGGRTPTAYELMIIVFAFSFTPLVTGLTVWMHRRKNRLVQGVYRFMLDDVGIHVSAPAFETVLKYSAIRKVVETKRFFLLFFSANAAQYIPKRAIPDGEIGTLRDFLTTRIGVGAA